jgi:hypothetical protein
MDLFVAGRDQSAASRLAKQPDWRSPPIVTMDSLFLTGEDQSQADQPNSLAEGPPM